MHEIDILNLPRKKTYMWFKTFENSTYGINVTMDITNLIKHVKKTKESFFIDMLYLVVKGLNSVDEMRMRIVDNKPVIYDTINPAITVMTSHDTFENVRFAYESDFKKFYLLAKENIDKAKYQTELTKNDYNPEGQWNEYYITCLPWLNFTSVTHPIPTDLSSQVVPRICWSKYYQNNDLYEITLNITVSHIFVDGLHISRAFNKIQELLNDAENLLK